MSRRLQQKQAQLRGNLLVARNFKLSCEDISDRCFQRSKCGKSLLMVCSRTSQSRGRSSRVTAAGWASSSGTRPRTTSSSARPTTTRWDEKKHALANNKAATRPVMCELQSSQTGHRCLSQPGSSHRMIVKVILCHAASEWMLPHGLCLCMHFSVREPGESSEEHGCLTSSIKLTGQICYCSFSQQRGHDEAFHRREEQHEV